MKNLTIHPFTSSDIPAVVDLQWAYKEVYPDARAIVGEHYLSPAFEGGRNVFCAFDQSGKLVGYAPLYAVLMRNASSLPHTLWVEIKTDPACEAPNEIKDLLFERLLLRAREVTSEFPEHPAHLTFQYFPSETASIEYVTSKGCRYTESVFTMRRDLSKDIPTFVLAGEIMLRPWRMESEAEQQQYVRAWNECFPEGPIAIEEWQYFMQSPYWEVGTTFAAFDGAELVGNVAVFWNEAENQATGNNIGFTEHIFVRSQWRGKNIARGLISVGLGYLKQHGLDEAQLEVHSKNESALSLYVDLGYEVIRESRFYVLEL
jgi:ribosomal protein S18 acetylase RimI-like enzyme